MSRGNCRYTVYDNKTGFPIAVNKTSEECAKQMGIKFSSWYNCVDRCGNGSNKRWTILKHDMWDQFCLEDYWEAEKSPLMIRITQLAEIMSTTDSRVVNLCKRMGVPIIRAGKQKIRMVSRKTFFAALKGGAE
ncbi:MAG: hypothetical protein J6S71_02745 [Clostridia bacterium]|nr:hypothetical protein [Clostridia bacterium]